MALFDDSDVKIFNSTLETKDAGDLVELASLLNQQRNNGNIFKAKSLGERLAALSPDCNSGIDLSNLIGDTFISSSAMYQIRVLLVFTAQTTLHRKLVLPLLSSSAVNAMYDKLIETSPDFYENISDGAAFTFYYLSIRRGKNIVSDIGEHFAMLCGKEGNAEFQELGAHIYTFAIQYIENIIDEYQFEEI